MTVVLREVSDEELTRACEIDDDAFENNPLGPILMPGPFPPDSAQQKAKKMIDSRKEDPTVYYLQAYDEEKGKMVAFSQWYFYETPDAVAAAHQSSPPTLTPGKNSETWSLFSSRMAERKREILGNRPHIFLQLLVTDPEFQGRGAGGLLLRWGLEKGNELGLPIYLESTEDGHGFYKKYGFEDIELLQTDFTPWGGPVHTQPLMMRMPQSP